MLSNGRGCEIKLQNMVCGSFKFIKLLHGDVGALLFSFRLKSRCRFKALTAATFLIGMRTWMQVTTLDIGNAVGIK